MAEFQLVTDFYFSQHIHMYTSDEVIHNTLAACLL